MKRFGPLGCLLLLAFCVTGCVYALRPSNPTTRQTLHIQAPTPERYVVRVADAQPHQVASDGHVSFEVPPLECLNTMRIETLLCGLMVLVLGCAPTPKQHTNDTVAREERVSDQYSRKAVKSYELFATEIENHVIMLVRLTTGEHFPMLCRKVDRGIYPISQSVFATPGTERWSVMCEPRVHNAYGLMRLELSSIDGALFMGGRRLSPAAKVPLLSAPAL